MEGAPQVTLGFNIKKRSKDLDDLGYPSIPNFGKPQKIIVSHVHHTSHENPCSKTTKKKQRLPGIVVVRVSLGRFDGLPKERQPWSKAYLYLEAGVLGKNVLGVQKTMETLCKKSGESPFSMYNSSRKVVHCSYSPVDAESLFEPGCKRHLLAQIKLKRGQILTHAMHMIK